MNITDYNLVGYYILLELSEEMEKRGKLILPTPTTDSVYFKVALVGKNVTAAEVGEEVMLHPTIPIAQVPKVMVNGREYICATEMDLFVKKPFTKPAEDGQLVEKGAE